MKAQVKPRINLENRTPLQDVIPLATPFVLFVDPVNTCNFQCTFCPTGDRALIKSTGRWQGRLDFDVYKKVIDDLGEFDQPLKVLRLYKEGEPLLHTRFADMVAYAKQSGHVQYIDTTTNGYLLTPEKVGPIIDAGMRQLWQTGWMHNRVRMIVASFLTKHLLIDWRAGEAWFWDTLVDGMNSAQFWEFTKTRVDFDRFVANIRHLYAHKGECEICIKIPGDILSPADRQRFFDTFGDIADRVFIENFAPCWPTFDIEERTGIEITEGIYGNAIAEVAVCPYIFYSMAVNTDGTVSLCFLDWARKLNIGDTRTESLKAIWNGPRMHRHRIAHLEGRRKANPTCGDCGQLSHCLPDNIDPYAADLLEKLSDGRPSVRIPVVAAR